MKTYHEHTGGPHSIVHIQVHNAAQNKGVQLKLRCTDLSGSSVKVQLVLSNNTEPDYVSLEQPIRPSDIMWDKMFDLMSFWNSSDSQIVTSPPLLSMLASAFDQVINAHATCECVFNRHTAEIDIHIRLKRSLVGWTLPKDITEEYFHEQVLQGY